MAVATPEGAMAETLASPYQPDRAPAPVVLLTDGELHTPDEEEAAAALVAAALYLADEQVALALALEAQQESWRWQASKVLQNQGVAPLRTPARPTWSSIERLRRARAGVAGIVGM